MLEQESPRSGGNTTPASVFPLLVFASVDSEDFQAGKNSGRDLRRRRIRDAFSECSNADNGRERRGHSSSEFRPAAIRE